jgi:hypothetical protein
VEFADRLPAGCPPPNAQAVDRDIVAYRIIDTPPPKASDFISHWNMNPGKRYRDECIARSLSIFSTLEECRAVMEGSLKFKNKGICRIKLAPGAGMILQNHQTGHISWWMAKDAEPLRYCEGME